LTNEQLGTRIKQIRTLKGLTQSELAKKLGITYQQIQKYEKGLADIKIERLSQVADAFAVNPAIFFDSAPLCENPGEYALQHRSAPNNNNEGALFVTKEEQFLLKLLRKINSRKIRTSIIKLLRGSIELSKQKETKS
jgi:transcriptional regulator with XRE-family HTH domain